MRPPRDVLVVGTDVRLLQDRGRLWSTNPALSDRVLARHLAVGLPVRLVARLARPGDTPVCPLDSPVEVRLVGGGRGLRGLLRLVRDTAGLALPAGSTVVVRVPEVVGMLLWVRGRRAGSTLVTHVVAFADGWAVMVPRPWQGLVGRGLDRAARAVVARSDAAVYVTERVLQERYPAAPGAPTLSMSDVVVPPHWLTERQERSGVVRTLVAVGSQQSVQKGHDVLVRAVAALVGRGHEVRLRLVGDGQEQPRLVELARTLGVEEAVDFAGLVSDRERLHRILQEADLFVMPSRSEALSRAMVEAMVCGLPCIGSAVGGLVELVPPRWQFPPGDVPALVDRIVRLVEHPQEAAALAREQRAHAARIVADADGTRMSDLVRDLVRDARAG